MKRIFILSCAALLFGPVLDAQESTPARLPMEPQGPSRPDPWRSSPPPAHEAIAVPVPVAPPKPNGPVQKSLVRRSEEHTSELQSRQYLVCRLLLEKKKQ